MINLYDKSKKGTIIISHYRSGGTQLLGSVRKVLDQSSIEFENIGEIDFDVFSGESFLTQSNRLLETNPKKYNLILLNNPLVICNWYNRGLFEELKRDYVLVVLERKDKIKSLLSLVIWEKLIEQNLFDVEFKSELEKITAMTKFHENLIQNPIPYKHIHLGWEYKMFFETNEGGDSPNVYYHLNYLLKSYQEEINTLHSIENDYNLEKIWYEDYEYNSMYLKNYFNNFGKKVVEKSIKRNYRKIPYVHNNFLDYCDEITQTIFKNWNLNDKINNI
jgi:hypothetical protein